MRGLEELRQVVDGGSKDADPLAALDTIAKTFVAKRQTDGLERLPIKDLQVDEEHQRPINRDTLTEMVEHLKAGGF